MSYAATSAKRGLPRDASDDVAACRECHPIEAHRSALQRYLRRRLRAHEDPEDYERITLGASGAARIVGDAQSAIAWRDGRVVLDDCPLSVALARFAEQGAPTVTLRDTAAGRMRVSGVFAVENIDSFLSAVAELHPVSWRRSARGYEVASR